MKDTISDISHQLKTPLAALNIYNGLMQQEVNDSPELKEFTSLSEQELDRIENLVQNLLKITKLDAGTITLEKQPQNVADMMDISKGILPIRHNSRKKRSFSPGMKKLPSSATRLG